MTKHKAKPIKVEAWQLGGGVDYPRWLVNAIESGTVNIYSTVDGVELAVIITAEGTLTAQPHSFIVRNEYGEFYLRRADIFVNEYDPDSEA